MSDDRDLSLLRFNEVKIFGCHMGKKSTAKLADRKSAAREDKKGANLHPLL